MGCDDYYLVPPDTVVGWPTTSFFTKVPLLPRYRVCKRNGAWRIYDRRGYWYDTDPTLVGAHTYATQLAVCDELFEEGGLTRLKVLQTRARR
jgi:hypothetical protein